MWVVRGEMGWTRAFHNTGRSHRSGRHVACQEWQSEFIGRSLERLSDMNQSATESLLCDSTRNYDTLL